MSTNTGGLKADLRLDAEARETLLEELERVRAEQHHVGDDGGEESNSGDSG